MKHATRITDCCLKTSLLHRVRTLFCNSCLQLGGKERNAKLLEHRGRTLHCARAVKSSTKSLPMYYDVTSSQQLHRQLVLDASPPNLKHGIA